VMVEMAIEMHGVTAGYGKLTVLRNVDLQLRRGEVLGVFGANGAGKTTLLRTISRLSTLIAGTISVGGRDVSRMGAVEVSRLGVAHVPEGRRVFRGMTVEDNLLVASRTTRRASSKRLDEVYQLFPRLGERRKQKAESLSGGEQQMLAIGRGLMMSPSVIMLDEPSQGLSPGAVAAVVDGVSRIAADGVTVMVVEQNFHVFLPVVSSAAVVSHGVVQAVADTDELRSGRALTRLLGGVI
jgi:branched-chain amino acid transport system ATP-binding protein